MKFTDSHEWIKLEQEIGTVGISTFAQKELGQVVYIEMPKIGKQVKAGEEIVILESTKAAADIYAPVSGQVVAINEELLGKIDLLNTSPEKEGWLFKIRLDNPDELKNLMSKEQYETLVS